MQVLPLGVQKRWVEAHVANQPVQKVASRASTSGEVLRDAVFLRSVRATWRLTLGSGRRGHHSDQLPGACDHTLAVGAPLNAPSSAFISFGSP